MASPVSGVSSALLDSPGLFGWWCKKGANFMDWVNSKMEWTKFEDEDDNICFREYPAPGRGVEGGRRLQIGKFDAPQDSDDQQDDARLCTSLLSFKDDFRIVNGMPAFHLKNPDDTVKVTCCRFSPCGAWLVSGYTDGSVRLWDARHGELYKLLSGGPVSPVCDVEIETYSDPQVGDGVISEIVHRIYSCGKSGQSSVNINEWEFSGDQVTRIPLQINSDGDQGSIVGKPHFERRNKILFALTVFKYTDSSRQWPTCKLEIKAKDVRKNEDYSTKQPNLNMSHLKCYNLSPSCRGLIGYISFIPGREKQHLTILWNDIREDGNIYITLSGCRSTWSKGGNLIATWNTYTDCEIKKSSLWKIRVYKIGESCDLLKTISEDGLAPIQCYFIPCPNNTTKQCLSACMMNVETGAISIMMYELSTFTTLYTLKTSLVLEVPETSADHQSSQDMAHNQRPQGCGAKISASGDHAWLGVIREGVGLIVDASHGVQELKLDISQFGNNIEDIRIGAQPGSFALFGPDGIRLMLPYTRSFALGSPAVNLERRSDFKGETSCQFSGNGQLLGVIDASQNHVVLLWEVDTKKKTCYEVHFDGDYFLNSFALSFDGNWLVTVSCENICLWRVNREELRSGNQIDAKCKGLAEIKGKNLGESKSFCSLWVEEEKERALVFVCREHECTQEPELIRFEVDIPSGEVEIQEFKTEGEVVTRCRLLDTPHDEWKAMMWNGGNAIVWDLLTMKRDSCFNKDNLDLASSVSIESRSDTSTSTAGTVKFNVCLEVDDSSTRSNCPAGSSSSGDSNQETPSEGNLTLRLAYEYGDWILAYDKDLKTDEGDGISGDYLEQEALKTLYLINTRTKLMTKLVSPVLRPTYGCAMSHDGRRVACVTTNKTICVWSPWASEGMIPGLSLLKMNKRLDGGALHSLLGKHGPALINMPDSTHMPLVMQLAHGLHGEEFDIMVKWLQRAAGDANDNDAKNIKMRLRPAHTDMPGLFKQDMKRYQSPDMAMRIMKTMMSGVAHPHEVAYGMGEFRKTLNEEYKVILYDTLNKSGLYHNIGTIKVPFNEVKKYQEDVLLETHNYLQKPEREYGSKQKGSRAILEQAMISSLLIPDAAKPGFDGLLSNLLIWKAGPEVFGTNAAKYIIDLKWQMYANKFVRQELKWHIFFLAIFTAYCICIGKYDFRSLRHMFSCRSGQATLVLLAISWLMSVLNLLREGIQLTRHWTQGSRGIKFYLESWPIKVFFTLVLFIAIPVTQFANGSPRNNTVLTRLLALECIYIWSKLLFYLRPLRKGGPFVVAIEHIAVATTNFLGLALIILLGFTCSFYIIFRHVRHTPRDTVVSAIKTDGYDSLTNAFGTFLQTLTTLFSYSLGEFELEDLYNIDFNSKKNKQLPSYVAISFFVVFVFFTVIILLNLLIAIMAESYDLKKQEIELLKARSFAIHDVETTMSDNRAEPIKKRLKTYVHIIKRSVSANSE